MIGTREERFLVRSRRPRHRIGVYWVWMSLWCSFGTSSGHQDLTHDITPKTIRDSSIATVEESTATPLVLSLVGIENK